ncbi:MAG TPA: hypothetical protein VLT33_14565 [Labilithrix sp.]|nr:hypothetical protein [Labilithrix sp.]
MKQAQRVMVLGIVLAGAVACSSEVPIGEGVGQKAGALGAVGQAPKSDGSCDVRLTACGGTCRDLGSDEANCGACGTICAPTNTCESGACTPPAPPPPPPVDAGPPPGDASTTCGSGQDFCGGACIDVLFDDKNCGGCGVACGGATKCVRATCM